MLIKTKSATKSADD